MVKLSKLGSLKRRDKLANFRAKNSLESNLWSATSWQKQICPVENVLGIL
ncbi:MAG: hypothetical protein IJT59_07320 [Desulfovibrionaceae bacterium]|nr:hypothetical protein [Desulfovibrionaceae bacterium]